jgi:hypothetical protein
MTKETIRETGGKEAQHTPGPWRIVDDGIAGPSWWVVSDALISDADAHLIAAAPDLLAALKGIIGIARAATFHSGGDHNRKRIAAAEAAIAKATQAEPAP